MFKKQGKRLMCVLLLAAAIVNGGETSAASSSTGLTNEVVLQSVNDGNTSIKFQIANSGTANISAAVIGKPGTSKIQMTVKLQKYNHNKKSWKSVKSWRSLSNSVCASLHTSYKLSGSGEYRCKLSADIWKNGCKESVSMTSVKRKYA